MRRLWFLLVVLLGLAGSASAQVTAPYTFTAGTTILSAEVNANFAMFGDALNRTGGTMTGSLTAQNILPDGDNTRDLGSAALSWNEAWFDGTVTMATLSVTTLTCTDCVALTTETSGNYVATITAGSGISGTVASEGSTPTIALAALTADWTQSGAFNIVLSNASAGIKILESTGATYYGIFDVGDLGADATYTFSGTSGTVLTSVTTAGGDVSGTYSALVVANDSHTHDAGNLTGATLAANVLATSITSVGTITTGIWNAGAVTSSSTIVATTSVSSPSLISTGAIGITPASGSSLSVTLATTGDFIVNANDLFVDTSQGNVGVNTATPLSTAALAVDAGSFAYAIAATANDTTGNEIALSVGADGAGGTIHYGLYATASGASTNYAIYAYSGTVYAAGPLAIGDAVVGAGFAVDITGGVNTIGVSVGMVAANSTAFSADVQATTGTNYGAQLVAVGSGATSNRALYLAATGATTNYAIYSIGGYIYSVGNLGIGDATPASPLTVGDGDLFQVSSGGSVTAGTWNAGAVTSSGGISGTTGTFSSTLQASGTVGFGGSPLTNVALYITGAGLSGTTQYGMFSQRMFTSAATGSGIAFYVQAVTDAASFTMGSASGLYIDSASAGSGSTITTNYGLRIGNQTAGGTNYAIYTGSGLVRFGEYGAGSATFDASGNISSVSDARFKDRIADLPYGLAEVLALRPVQHGYNELSGLERDHLYGGFLAQDVQRVMPIAVGVDQRGYLTLADRPILGAVVNSIHTLDARLAILEAQVASLSR